MTARNQYSGRAVLDRFTFFIQPEPNSGCWLWAGDSAAAGYGRFWLNGRTQYAHRVSWEMEFGPIPQDMNVCHRCDNPYCVNPHHLFLGTDAENAADRNSKGRSARGERNRHAVLTQDQVLSIRQDTRKIASIARQYGVTWTSIARIKQGRNWRHCE